MAFKKTSEGRVFFQNLDEAKPSGIPKKAAPAKVANQAKPPLRTSRTQAGGGTAAAGAQTQFQIIALLKTLNAKLQNTQSERDEMKKQLDRYERLVIRLEEKADRTHNAYETLNKSVKSKDKEMLEQSRRAEQIAQEAFTELEEARKLILELEEKTEISEQEIKRQATQRKKIEADIAARQAEFEVFQKKLADHSLTNKNLTKRLNRTEEQQETLGLQVSNAVSNQDVLDRKIEKTIQERTRMIRKVDRIEEAVMQTRDAMNAKAMVLLTDQSASGGAAALPASLDDMDPDAIQALIRAQAEAAQRSEEDALMPWWKKSVRFTPLGAASVLVIALLAGWLVSEVQKPAISDIDIFQMPQQGTAVPAIEPASGVEEGLGTIGDKLGDLGQAGMEKAGEVSAQAQEFVSRMLGEGATDAAATGAENNVAASAEDLTVASTQIAQPSTDSSINPVPNVALAQEPQAMMATPAVPATEPAINNDIGALDINDEEALLRALDENPQAVAQQLNALEPSSKPPATAAQTTRLVTQQADAMQATDIESAFAKNPDFYNDADADLPEAMRPVEEQALGGVAEAQHDLAAIYTAGHGGVAQDYKRAAYWFEKAAKNGIANGAYNLAVLYHQGLGLDADLNKAVQWYKAAATMGHPEAQYNLGIAHIEGVGVSYDPFKATAYFEQAASNQVIEAAYNLGLIHENGLLGEPKPDEASMWYKMAADQGSPEARAAIQQLAKSMNVGLDEINRLADSLQAAKNARDQVSSN